MDKYRQHYQDDYREPTRWEMLLWVVCCVVAAISLYLLITMKGAPQ